MNTTAPAKLVNADEAARILCTTPGTLAVWRHRGRGPAYRKICNSVRYELSELQSFIDAGRRTNTAQQSAPAEAVPA